MRGSVVKRGNTWSYVVDVGRDPVSNRRRQRWRGGFATKRGRAGVGSRAGGGRRVPRPVDRGTRAIAQAVDREELPRDCAVVRPAPTRRREAGRPQRAPDQKSVRRPARERRSATARRAIAGHGRGRAPGVAQGTQRRGAVGAPFAESAGWCEAAAARRAGDARVDSGRGAPVPARRCGRPSVRAVGTSPRNRDAPRRDSPACGGPTLFSRMGTAVGIGRAGRTRPRCAGCGDRSHRARPAS